MLADTRLEEDLPDLLWSVVNLFHRKIDRVERELDDNEQAQRRSQAEQDGSEVKSVELERLIDQGQSLIERRNSFEFFRDHAAELFEVATGSAWRPRAGSIVNHRALTAAMIDSREFLAARRRAETELLVPAGTRIAFTGGMDCNDHQRIWAVLDKARAKHPDMVLLHGGSPRGAERIAACWADNHKVAQIVFKPDWTRHGKAAPFKRNDQMLEALPAGLVAFPGSGISANLADKARKLGIPVWRFTDELVPGEDRGRRRIGAVSADASALVGPSPALRSSSRARRTSSKPNRPSALRAYWRGYDPAAYRRQSMYQLVRQVSLARTDEQIGFAVALAACERIVATMCD